MGKIVWDRFGNRVYETGLDRGVLYLPNGSAVPWNGLTSIIEKFNREVSSVYFDGMKIHDAVVLGDFSATMKAVTYPEEFTELEGMASDKSGIWYADQPPQTFGLCYRTQVGNDLEGNDAGYKIHILYNVTAVPNDKTYASLGADPSLVEFEWTISSVPEEIPGYYPTAHIIIDSTKTDPWLLEELEEMLYGTSLAAAALIPMTELVTFISEWYRIQIVDHGDGTWSAISERDEFIDLDIVEQYFEINGANAVFLDLETFIISDTASITDVPQIGLNDNGDGTWTATTEQDNLIVMTGPYTFEIRNATAVYQDEDRWEITDTFADN